MANAIYPLFKQALLNGSAPDLTAGAVKVLLVDLADYTYSAAHQFLSDVPVAAREETSAALSSVTVTNGTLDSANPVFTAATGDTCEALILFNDTGSAGTSHLIAYYDTGVTGLPVTLNGGDVNVTVNASGWLSL